MYISLWHCLFQHCLQELRLTCGWRSVCRIFACLGTTMGIWAVLIEQLEMTWTIWVMLFIKCMSHWSAVCYLLEMKQGVQLMPAKSHVMPFLCLFHHPRVALGVWSWNVAASFLQAFSHTSPFTSLCAHLGLACFLSLNLVLPTRTGQNYSSLSF